MLAIVEEYLALYYRMQRKDLSDRDRMKLDIRMADLLERMDATACDQLMAWRRREAEIIEKNLGGPK